MVVNCAGYRLPGKIIGFPWAEVQNFVLPRFYIFVLQYNHGLCIRMALAVFFYLVRGHNHKGS